MHATLVVLGVLCLHVAQIVAVVHAEALYCVEDGSGARPRRGAQRAAAVPNAAAPQPRDLDMPTHPSHSHQPPTGFRNSTLLIDLAGVRDASCSCHLCSCAARGAAALAAAVPAHGGAAGAGSGGGQAVQPPCDLSPHQGAPLAPGVNQVPAAGVLAAHSRKAAPPPMTGAAGPLLLRLGAACACGAPAAAPAPAGGSGGCRGGAGVWVMPPPPGLGGDVRGTPSDCPPGALRLRPFELVNAGLGAAAGPAGAKSGCAGEGGGGTCGASSAGGAAVEGPPPPPLRPEAYPIQLLLPTPANITAAAAGGAFAVAWDGVLRWLPPGAAGLAEAAGAAAGGRVVTVGVALLRMAFGFLMTVAVLRWLGVERRR